MGAALQIFRDVSARGHVCQVVCLFAYLGVETMRRCLDGQLLWLCDAFEKMGGDGAGDTDDGLVEQAVKFGLRYTWSS